MKIATSHIGYSIQRPEFFGADGGLSIRVLQNALDDQA